LFWQGMFIVFCFPLYQVKKLCKRICRKEDIPVEQEHCSFKIQTRDSNREDCTYNTHYLHYTSYDHYCYYTGYTHVLQVHVDHGIADHVWQDK
jgi:hypothetical protein